MNDLDLRAALHRDADLAGEPSPNLLEQLAQRRRHQRRQRAGVLTAALAVAVIAAGIPVGQTLLTRADGGPASGTVAEVTPSATTDTDPTPPPYAPTPSPDVTATPSETPTAAPSTVAPETTAPAPTTSDALVLGPDGLGALKLGMSRDEAQATGLVEPFFNYVESAQCLWRSALMGASSGRGTVFYSDTLGVATIDAYPGIHTPEGIGIGSSLAAVERAYPGLSMAEPGFESTGRRYTLVPGNSQAVFRIALVDSKVVELTLQYAAQNCYE